MSLEIHCCFPCEAFGLYNGKQWERMETIKFGIRLNLEFAWHRLFLNIFSQVPETFWTKLKALEHLLPITGWERSCYPGSKSLNELLSPLQRWNHPCGQNFRTPAFSSGTWLVSRLWALRISHPSQRKREFRFSHPLLGNKVTTNIDSSNDLEEKVRVVLRSWASFANPTLEACVKV